MQDTAGFLARVADKIGFQRERYIERNMPTNLSSVMVLPFYGDLRSQMVAATMLLPRIRKEKHASRYFILCSYPDCQGLYPCVDEYWSPKDMGLVNELWNKTNKFRNSETKLTSCEQQLNRHFENVISPEIFERYYDQGLTQAFFDDFKWIVNEMPALPSARLEMNRQIAMRGGMKVFILASKKWRYWQRGKEDSITCPIDFWKHFGNILLKNDFTPIFWQHPLAYDMSPSFADKAIYCQDKGLEALAAMRASACVIDMFSDLSKWSIMARCPFVSCVERRYYTTLKDYEINDLTAKGLPYRYIFNFPTMLEGGEWGALVDGLLKKLLEFVPDLDKDKLPSTSEVSAIAPYSSVRRSKKKRIGSRFVRVPKV